MEPGTTLMNVISGNHEIDNGELWNIDNLSIKYFNQNFRFNDENQSVNDEITSSIKNKMKIRLIFFVTI